MTNKQQQHPPTSWASVLIPSISILAAIAIGLLVMYIAGRLK